MTLDHQSRDVLELAVANDALLEMMGAAMKSRDDADLYAEIFRFEQVTTVIRSANSRLMEMVLNDLRIVEEGRVSP